MFYNVDTVQTLNDRPVYGYLCVYVLKEVAKGLPFKNVLIFCFIINVDGYNNFVWYFWLSDYNPQC